MGKAFEHVPVDEAVSDYSRHVSDPRLMWLSETILRGDRTGTRLIGIDQGCPFSPQTMNLAMHYALDLPQLAAGWGHPLYVRYADNLLYLTESASDGRQRLDQARRLLAPAFALKGEGNQPVNLRRQGASADVLGYRLALANSQIRVELGEKAYGGLHQALQ